MDPEFWHERWRNDEIGFHESRPNRLLVQYFDRLSLTPGSRVFLPLCGKTLDIGWLLARGFQVSGIELNMDAVEQLFRELGVAPETDDVGDLKRYRADAVEILVGDVFSLSASALGPVDAVYDRAALVALPEQTRRRYAAHLRQITNSARQLLICFEYDQSLMAGPPFSIPEAEIAALYGAYYDIERLSAVDVPGLLKEVCPATETVWLLQRN